MKYSLTNRMHLPVLLCNANGIAAPVKNSLCCAAAAAGITKALSDTTGVLIPHKKLREAAPPNATLNAQNRPPAQPAEGYKHPSCSPERTAKIAANKVQINERAEFEKEFPVPEGLQYCTQRETYITALGAKTSDSFAREHYAYRAGFAAWKRRAWKHSALINQLTQADV